MSRYVAVVTTIQRPTKSLIKLQEVVNKFMDKLIIVGDKKTPDQFFYDFPCDFYSLDDQHKFPFRLAKLLPVNHYSRKNIGYLLAMKNGADCIYETDDDNMPLKTWVLRNRICTARIGSVTSNGWINIYDYFTDIFVWPRGFPLEKIRVFRENSAKEDIRSDSNNLFSINSPVQQGLVNGSPDVDSIWRLLYDTEITFKRQASVSLPKNIWCPFNSQSTWWWSPAFPLMYLPSFCSFRMTDIWRSFVAIRCLWELEYSVVFHSAEVWQERNIHNLINDFKEEIPGFLNNVAITETLTRLILEKGHHSVATNLYRCYEALVKKGFYPPEELKLLANWIKDLTSIGILEPDRKYH